MAGHGYLACYPRRLPGDRLHSMPQSQDLTLTGASREINLQPTTERDALMHSGLYLLSIVIVTRYTQTPSYYETKDKEYRPTKYKIIVCYAEIQTGT